VERARTLGRRSAVLSAAAGENAFYSEGVALLEVEQVSVSFGGVRALQRVDLDVAAGQAAGLIGPNGAGKTTLFNAICGLQAIEGGRIRLAGRDIVGVAAHKRARLGIARTFQRLEVFGSMSVRDNIRVAADVRRRWAGKDGTPPAERTEELLDRVGLRAVAGERVEALPTGLARLVEVGRALASEPTVLLLDEPSSGLDEDETDGLAELLEELTGDGLAVLLVEHDVELVMRVCGTVHVLDFGRVIAAGTPAEVQSDPQVQAAYLGTATG
jgi:branched-chain amino acid transport system ATP-binding protein